MDQGTELVLPSGARIGHRSFRRYWKQNMKPVQIVPGSMQDPQMASRLTNNYKMLGYGYSGALTVQQRLELKVQKRESIRQLRRQQDHTARVGMKHNYLQHHYREQNPF